MCYSYFGRARNLPQSSTGKQLSKRDKRVRLWEAGSTVCPLCARPLTLDDARTGTATLEHTPPLKAGKPHIVLLSCRSCNAGAGSKIDIAASEALSYQVTGLLVTEDTSLSVRISTRPHSHAVRPRLSLSHDAVPFDLFIYPTRNQPWPPNLLPTFTLRFRQHMPWPVQVGLLKSAYLALFGIIGADLATAKAFDAVRKQIRTPNEKIFTSFCAGIQDTGRNICIVQRDGKHCWAVRLNHYVVFLPAMDHDDFPLLSTREHVIQNAKQLTQTFGAGLAPLFPRTWDFPLDSLPVGIQCGVARVGTLGWDLVARRAGVEPVHGVSIGRTAESVRILPIQPC